ncbi:hypothetical protein WOLCODRAFT_137108 [Wolfiporia cocos MD-104 SS10]|uniref:Uncharacterized protein n=1 Tax=Wolfiporia cocos (strain MD-104) TaxID=742152 RepID=A0A2H3JHD9_WOLCO|nr:hypothetical protein WOLCODRAFT_137108 [Wolfiporia cocos MD-104 SS10]
MAWHRARVEQRARAAETQTSHWPNLVGTDDVAIVNGRSCIIRRRTRRFHRSSEAELARPMISTDRCRSPGTASAGSRRWIS